MPLDIRRTLVISTAHITKEVDTELWRKDNDLPFAYEALDQAWLVWVPCEDEPEREGIPDCLKTVFDFARTHACTMLILDADGDKLDELPKWEW
jgi:hypothetical protein